MLASPGGISLNRGIAISRKSKPIDRRVTAGRVLYLLLQLLLAWFTFQRIRSILSGSPWGGLHAVGALFSMLAAAGLGMAGLEGMIKASLGSIPYRVAFALSS